MKNKIKNILEKLTPWSIDNDVTAKNYESKKEAMFVLSYKAKKIGILLHKNSKWIFKYSDEYIKNQFVSLLIDFPIIDKVYEFEELPPFFAARIPSLNQPFHTKKIKKHNGDKNDLVSLLEIFGKKSINNPYELVLN